MNLIQSLVDNVGDLIGTSKLAQLNRTVFHPVLGTGITRSEYNMCNGADLFDVPGHTDRRSLKEQSDRERRVSANQLLEVMIDNGTVFKEGRILEFVNNVPGNAGANPIGVKTMRQMSSDNRSRLQQRLNVDGMR